MTVFRQDTGGPAASARPAAAIPGIAAEMQQEVERLYLSKMELEQRVRALDAAHPVICMRPRRPSALVRGLMRISLRLRWRIQAAAVAGSGLFDRNWYLETYEDVRASGADPALHFVRFGAAEERNPGPYFDTGHYLRMYPDIAGNGMNPLWHYLVSGWSEQRSVRPGMPHGGTR